MLFRSMRVNTERMRSAAAEGFINATDCADYLVKKGMPFRDAYTVVGKLVNFCISSGKTLETLTLDEYKEISEVFDEDVYGAIDLETCVNTRNVEGGPAFGQVMAQIENIRTFLKVRGDQIET